MDREQAQRIFNSDGETVNAITSAGTVVKSPRILVDLYVDGDLVNNSPYGSLKVEADVLDYMVYRLHSDLTLKDQTQFYKEHNVMAEVYTWEDDEVSVTEYQHEDEEWTSK